MEGPSVNTIKNSSNVELIPVKTTAVVYTPSISLKQGEYFALMYKATSGGNVKLKIEMEESYKLPVTEEASDTYWSVSESATAIEAALDDEDWHVKKIEPITAPYLRIKITGLGAPSANDASTTLNLKLGILG